ncbi:holo-ACP synthase [Gulosibacter bifidus]|uniref:Holo-[acyl-carrier-protein] synthase n=1 Tax=Gulosibacter bifidus TaxID=272239 RepID=A0ABW5RHA7_9MICO|nr:holo-ACP synthase [Gulosibacter bifidus]
MIVGIGVDSIEHERVRDAISSPAFAARVFTPEELELPLTSISARWAAREAAVKALGGLHGMRLRDLAVTRTHLGRPVFVQSPELDRVLARLGVNELHLSLTHDQTTSCAFVVAERH